MGGPGVNPHGVTVIPVRINEYEVLSIANFGQVQVDDDVRVQFGALVLPNKYAVLHAHADNAGDVCIGNQVVTNTVDGTGNGYIMSPGDVLIIAVDNMQRLWANATADDCVISWHAS